MNPTKMSLITGILFLLAGLLMLGAYLTGRKDTWTIASCVLFLLAGGMQLYAYNRRRKLRQ